MRLAFYPGNFDPITNGHLDIIMRAAALFDQVVVAPVEAGSRESLLFSIAERVEMARQVLPPASNIKVQSFSGLSVDFARTIGASIIIRGLRQVSDFEYELQLHHTNKRLSPEIETCLITASERFSFITSSIVKEIAQQGGDVSELVPAPVARQLAQFFGSARSIAAS